MRAPWATCSHVWQPFLVTAGGQHGSRKQGCLRPTCGDAAQVWVPVYHGHTHGEGCLRVAAGGRHVLHDGIQQRGHALGCRGLQVVWELGAGPALQQQQ